MLKKIKNDNFATAKGSYIHCLIVSKDLVPGLLHFYLETAAIYFVRLSIIVIGLSATFTFSTHL